MLLAVNTETDNTPQRGVISALSASQI